MRYGKKVTQCSLLAIVALFSNAAFAQDATNIAGLPNPDPKPWLQPESNTYFSYIAALRVSPEIIAAHLGRQPDAIDLTVLHDAIQKLDSVPARSDEFRKGVCQKFESESHLASGRELLIYGDDLNSAESMLAEDVVLLFENTKANLTTDASNALQNIRESMQSSSSNNLDWQEYALRAPDGMKISATAFCRSVLNKSPASK